MLKEEAFYIGYFTKTKGLKGEIQLYFEFDAYEDLDLDVVFADMNGKMVPFFVASHKLYPNSTGLFYFDDLDHIDKAQALVKKKVYLPLDKMPERDEDDFTYDDLKGFIVSDETHGELGEIIEVNEYPQHFVATVVYKNKEILFPLNEDMIVEIDEDEKTLLVDLPEGLLDLYLNS
ncbi:ribosome maturation factor RimM [Pedobacter cryotolerans]|uniref:Ribosome maturation factor RimM n=1 Tax=Pedobacter cryotolerans TaxID=2571270 RepID=A0A4V5P1I7_9SPHI|nr:ribosome maturation factor RimM [Pedobacter cryotolerans]TKC03134.1 16S rRNA processing protein RimM [Pedobacter cryotolerans]